MPEKSPPDVETLISKEMLLVRPGRHDLRKVDHKKVVSFLYKSSLTSNIICNFLKQMKTAVYLCCFKKFIVSEKRITLSLFLIKIEIG